MVGGALCLEKLLKLPIIGIDAFALVFVNGRYIPEMSDLNGADGIDVIVGENGFGVNIKIPDGAKYEKPLHVIEYIDCSDGDLKQEGVLFNSESNIVVGNGAKLVLLESRISNNDIYFNFKSTFHIDVGEDADLERYVIYDVSTKSKVKFLLDVNVANRARFWNVSAGLGVGDADLHNVVNIYSDANVGFYSVIRAERDANANLSVELYHNGDRGKSDVGLWAVNDGRVEFNTDAKVLKGVNDVYTSQVSRILLNSDDAIGRIKPFQFISTEGAKAFHGAVVSGIKEEELFFLCSRGMNETMARKTIAESVIANILLFVDKEDIKDAMEVCLQK